MSEFASNKSTTVRPPAAERPDWTWSLSSSETSNASEQSERDSASNHGHQGSKKRKSTSEEHFTKRRKTSEPSEDGSSYSNLLRRYINRSKKRSRVDDQEEGSEETLCSSFESPNKRKKGKKATSGGNSEEDFWAKYEQVHLLGSGGFGAVYAGYRREDDLPVAIKHIFREDVMFMDDERNGKTLPQEVAIMQELAKGKEFGKSSVISLLDFYDLDDELIIVMERPIPAADLGDYISNKGEALQEEESRVILKQLVEAAKELEAKNVFHRDIKVDNMLIHTSTDIPGVKLIDFGLSCFTTKSAAYERFRGTRAHMPPECHNRDLHRPGPTTVWQIGVVLYEMLHSQTCFETISFLEKDISISKNLSPECKEILNLLLTEDPLQRPSLDQLSRHPWLCKDSA